MRCSVVATLSAGEARATWTLAPDPERKARAFAHALGWSVAHLDAQLPEPFRARASALQRALSALGDTPTDEPTALPRIARAMASAIPGAKLVVRRRLPIDQRAPRWPVTIRSGAPSDAGRGIWPYDAELGGLLLGRRRLILRESLSLALAERDAAWLASRGVLVRHGPTSVGDPIGPQRLFASMEPAILDEAPSRHAEACSADERFMGGARWMGAMLGYPSCCVERFVRVRARDDVTLFAELNPPLPHAPMSPLVGWLDGALALISYAPCSPTCGETRALAQALLDEIERRSEGFSDRWRALARRVHALTEDGRLLAFEAEGDLVNEGAIRVGHAVELTPPEGDDLSRLATARDDLEGKELRIERGFLVAPEVPGFMATIVADHRGGP
jgi:hypothetical protein